MVCWVDGPCVFYGSLVKYRAKKVFDGKGVAQKVIFVVYLHH